MSRRSLRPQLNQIRGWVRQGRTDAWIAHQLEVTVQQIQAFKREQGLEPDAEDAGAPEEVDLRAEDDAQIAAELEEEAARKAEEEARAAEEAARKAEEAEKAEAEAAAKAAEREEAEGDDEEEKPKRSRRRGGRSRRRTASAGPLEGTFDHGEEGYGLWLDPAIQDDPIYAEHWAGHRPVEISIEEDQIVIRRAGTAEDEDDD
jgi:septal ring factor EnvC (AmiA/AmiB activator)